MDLTSMKYKLGELVSRIDKNKVLNFFKNNLQKRYKINIDSILKEIFVAEKFEERMRRYDLVKKEDEASFS